MSVEPVAVGAVVRGRVSHAEFLAERRFGSLDGLRGLSILAVIWHHVAAPDFAGTRLAYVGTEGVTLFFAISGFLITTLLLRERERNSVVDLRAFYIRRSLRIFPLYYAVLLVYLALVLAMERNSAAGRQFLDNFIYFVTYTSNWFVVLDGRVIFYFAWSLAAEEQFYLVWPVLIKWTKTIARALLVVGLFISLLVGIELFAPANGRPPAGWLWFSLKMPLAIILGVIAALALHTPRGFALLSPLVASRGASTVWILLVLLALSLQATPRIVLHAALAGLVVACVVNRRHWLAGALAWKPLAYIGTISYGMYLLHMLAKNAVTKVLGKAAPEAGWPVVLVLTTVLAVLAATLSYRYFESYFLSLKSRFER